MAKSVDATDSKSVGRKPVGVRVPLPVPSCPVASALSARNLSKLLVSGSGGVFPPTGSIKRAVVGCDAVRSKRSEKVRVPLPVPSCPVASALSARNLSKLLVSGSGGVFPPTGSIKRAVVGCDAVRSKRSEKVRVPLPVQATLRVADLGSWWKDERRKTKDCLLSVVCCLRAAGPPA